MSMTRTISATVGLGLMCLGMGCSATDVYKKSIKLGVQVVGDQVHEADVKSMTDKLVSRPPSAADAEFGRRIDTYSDTRSRRVLAVYPVKQDLTNSYRWIVEIENDRIVALGKAIRNADIGEDQVKAFVMKETLKGKTAKEIEQKSKFSKLVLVLRRQSNGLIVRVYDFTGMTDVMDARYCLVEFDKSDRMTEARLLTVPAASQNSKIRPKR